MQHNMHVHVNRIGWQNDASACGGQFTAGHYDPHGVARNSTLYSAECGQMYPHRCEVGDTSRKTGQFNLDGSGFVRHDVNLPLDGNYRGMRTCVCVCVCVCVCARVCLIKLVKHTDFVILKRLHRFVGLCWYMKQGNRHNC